jgi:hypothetical protein
MLQATHSHEEKWHMMIHAREVVILLGSHLRSIQEGGELFYHKKSLFVRVKRRLLMIDPTYNNGPQI